MTNHTTTCIMSFASIPQQRRPDRDLLPFQFLPYPYSSSSSMSPAQNQYLINTSVLNVGITQQKVHLHCRIFNLELRIHSFASGRRATASRCETVHLLDVVGGALDGVELKPRHGSLSLLSHRGA